MSTTALEEFDHLAANDVFVTRISSTFATDKEHQTFVCEFQFVRKSLLTIDAVDLATNLPALIVWSSFWGCWSVNNERSRVELVPA